MLSILVLMVPRASIAFTDIAIASITLVFSFFVGGSNFSGKAFLGRGNFYGFFFWEGDFLFLISFGGGGEICGNFFLGVFEFSRGAFYGVILFFFVVGRSIDSGENMDGGRIFCAVFSAEFRIFEGGTFRRFVLNFWGFSGRRNFDL